MKKACLLLFVVFVFQKTYADSPLTSTYFAEVYMSNAKIGMIVESKLKVLDKKLCSYLNSEKVSIAERLAVINALGWDLDGQSNFEIYLDFLVKKEKKVTHENFKQACTSEQLICLAYLKAMDNYFDVKDALEIADLAIQKDKSKLYSIHIIQGLIKAQSVFDESWCKVFHATDTVRKDDSLKMDMKAEAVKAIFDYMDLYADSCT